MKSLLARTLPVLSCSLLLVLLTACDRADSRSDSDGKLRVLTSFLPVQAHTAAIAGDHAAVTQLLSADTGPHDFQPTPGDVKRLAEADLFIVNGVGLESWLADLVDSAGRPDLTVVDLSDGLTLTENPAVFADTGTAEAGQNPHTWLDPVLAKQQVATILSALRKADPDNAASYAANAATYTAQLETLDADFRGTLGPLENKNLVTFHDAFPYLAARYGLNYIGCISEFPEKDPPPQQLAALVDAIRTQKVGVLFAETGYTPDLLDELARQTGARVSQLDTMELGLGTPTAYLERMRANLASLREAFAP